MPPDTRQPSAWSEFGDGHDYSRTGKHDPLHCRFCMKRLRSSQPAEREALREQIRAWFAERMETAERAKAQYLDGAAERTGAEAEMYRIYAGVSAVEVNGLRALAASLDFDLFERASQGDPAPSPPTTTAKDDLDLRASKFPASSEARRHADPYKVPSATTTFRLPCEADVQAPGPSDPAPDERVDPNQEPTK